MFGLGKTRKKAAFRLLTLVLICVLLPLSLTVGQVDAQGGPGNPPPGGNPPSGNPPSGAPPGDGSGGGLGGSDSSTNPVLSSDCGAYTLDGETSESTGQAYDSASDDESAICVVNGGSLTLVNPTITKTGETSSSDSSSFYGLNAAVLAGSGSTVTISGGTVTTDGSGTNGVFATGEGSSVTLSDLTITAIGDGAHAVMATLGGTLSLTNVDMLTTDSHSGAVATDRGSGTITVTGGTVTTTGPDSPAVYSTGLITVTDATLEATGAESVVIEGANSVTLIDSDVTSSIEDKWGVMIYQSMSGDAEGTEGVFTMTGGSLAHTAASGPLFFNTNSTAIITLTDVDVTVESGILVQAGATERWGNAGSNGGTVIFTADTQALTGDLIADEISAIALTLHNGSSLTGAINPDGTAREANLTLDATSTWTVTADSVLTCLTNPDGIADGTITNITGDGFTVTYDADACPALGGATYSLTGGGVLQPAA